MEQYSSLNYHTVLKKNRISTGKGLGICVIIVTSLLLSFTSCRQEKPYEVYHKFENQTWTRFNQLNFEIPISNLDKPYDIVLYANFTRDFPHESLEVNVIMNTPSGEERINAFLMKVKSKSGTFILPFENDSYKGEILLKKELLISKAGTLHIELENLIPRMKAEGILGIGIRLIRSGK